MRNITFPSSNTLKLLMDTLQNFDPYSHLRDKWWIYFPNNINKSQTPNFIRIFRVVGFSRHYS